MTRIYCCWEVYCDLSLWPFISEKGKKINTRLKILTYVIWSQVKPYAFKHDIHFDNGKYKETHYIKYTHTLLNVQENMES